MSHRAKFVSTMRQELLIEQTSLPGMCLVEAAVDSLALASAADERGAVFTRREVVDFMLDLAGYTDDKALWKVTLLEPSFGNGDFLLPAIERLLSARRKEIQAGKQVGHLAACIRAVELHKDTFEATRANVIARLVLAEFSGGEAQALADTWLIQADFLLCPLTQSFDVVIGNPPYVRQELIPTALVNEYRKRYSTLYDRADLYIPFFHRALDLLRDGGELCFICSDRWMKNKYGTPLRGFVSKEYWLRAYVDMTDTPAFHAQVIAYPAITLIQRAQAGVTRVAAKPDICEQSLEILSQALLGDTILARSGVREIKDVVQGCEPWILDAADHILIVRRLEALFPLLEEAGCKVGIGVATGADRAFVAPYDALDVEADRKLPLVMTKDITSGQVVWRGAGVINPFTDEGPLVNLDKYPKLKAYLEAHKGEIAGRHVAQKAPGNCYRTIDRITPSLASRPKLLIPDIKGQAQVVYEEGRFYPHHNLYYVESNEWDLYALQAVLLSGLTKLFVAAYSTKMRGGFLRFQAQYLRRIRLPRWATVSDALRGELIAAAKALDIPSANEAVAKVYGLTAGELELISATSNGRANAIGAD